MKTTCPKCSQSAAAAELMHWPFACERCVGRYAHIIMRAQNEAIARWEASERSLAAAGRSRRWIEGVRAGLREQGLL